MGPMDEGNHYIEGEKSSKHETDFHCAQLAPITRITRSQTSRADNHDKGSNDGHIIEMSVVRELDFQNKCLPINRRVSRTIKIEASYEGSNCNPELRRSVGSDLKPQIVRSLNTSRTIRSKILKVTSSEGCSNNFDTPTETQYKYGRDFKDHCVLVSTSESQQQASKSSCSDEGNAHRETKESFENDPHFSSESFSITTRSSRSRISKATVSKNTNSTVPEKPLRCSTNTLSAYYSISGDHLLEKSKTTIKDKGRDDVGSVCRKRRKRSTDFQAHCLQIGRGTSEAQTPKLTLDIIGNDHDFKAKGCVECNPNFENAHFSTVSRTTHANGKSCVLNLKGGKSLNNNSNFQSPSFSASTGVTRSQTFNATAIGDSKNVCNSEAERSSYDIDFGNSYLSRTVKVMQNQFSKTSNDEGRNSLDVKNKKSKYVTRSQSLCAPESNKVSLSQFIKSAADKGSNHDPRIISYEQTAELQNPHVSVVSRGSCSCTRKNVNNESQHKRKSKRKKRGKCFKTGNRKMQDKSKINHSSKTAINTEDSNGLSDKNAQKPSVSESKEMSQLQTIKSAVNKGDDHDSEASISNMHFAEFRNPYVSVLGSASHSCTDKSIVNDESQHKRKSKRKKRGKCFKTGKTKMQSKSKINQSSKTAINAEDSNGLSDKNEKSKYATNAQKPCVSESKKMSQLQTTKSAAHKGNDQDSETSIFNMHFVEFQNPYVSALGSASHSCTDKSIVNDETQHKRKSKRKRRGKCFKTGKTKMQSKSKISKSSKTAINAEGSYGLSDKNKKSKHATNPQNSCALESKRMSQVQTIKSAVNKGNDQDSETSIFNMHFVEFQNPYVSALNSASHSCTEKSIVNNESEHKRKSKRKKRGKHVKISKGKMSHERKESDNIKQNLCSGLSYDIENSNEVYFREQSYMQKQSVPVLDENQNMQVLQNFKFVPLEGLTPFKSSSHNFVDHLNLVRGGQKLSVAYKMGTKQLLIDNIANFHPCTQTMPFRRLVTSMAWHPTYTSILAVASECGDILLWDIRKCFQDEESFRTNLGESVSSIKFHNSKPLCVYTTLLTGELLLQNLESKSSTDLLDGIAWNKSFTSLDVSFKKKILIAGDNSGCACLTSLEGEQITKRIRLHKSKVTHIEFSTRDDYLVATTSTDNTVKLWDLRKLSSDSRRCSYLTQLVHSKSVNSAYFSIANGSSLLTTGLDEDVKVYVGPLWHLETVITRPQRYLHHRIPIKANWHPLHNIIVMGRYPEDGFGSIDGLGIGFYDGQNGELLHQFLPPLVTGIVSYNSFNPTGEFLASGAGSKVVLWKSSDDSKIGI